MKQSLNLYPLRFERQVENFIDDFSRFGIKKLSTIHLGISGGADSVALLRFCYQLKIKQPHLSFVVLHFNHQSRPAENLQEQQFVEKLSLTFGFTFICESFHGSSHSEDSWRAARYNFFQKILQPELIQKDEKPQLWLGHHLDDSWEWSLMQQAKSGNIQGCLGIPVRHGHIFRPFLCVSKKHIRRYLLAKKQTFLEDSSNSDTAYERNWWRINVLNSLQKKYPQVLKHYVQRSTELALKFNLIAGQTEQAKIHIIDSQTHRFHFSDTQKAQHSAHLIKKSLHQLSSHNRMKLYKQLRILFESYKKRNKGPISFSGGVKAYLTPNTIILTNKKDYNFNNDILNAK